LFEETHKKKKSTVFTHAELFEFINKVNNQVYLVIKLIVLFCYFKALHMSECVMISRKDIISTPLRLVVSIVRTKTDKANVRTTFVIPHITGEGNIDLIELYKEYLILMNHCTKKRFFLTY
jgi:hypothetical protein